MLLLLFLLSSEENPPPPLADDVPRGTWRTHFIGAFASDPPLILSDRGRNDVEEDINASDVHNPTREKLKKDTKYRDTRLRGWFGLDVDIEEEDMVVVY